MKKTETITKPDVPSPFQRVLPKGIRTGKDHLILRMDFYTESVVMQDFTKNGGTFKMVDVRDIAHALTQELSFSSGILPANTLWWSNDANGAVVALWIEPGIRRVALQVEVMKPPERYNVPLPGLIFLCRPGRPPSVFAAAHRPTGPKDKIFKAPLANVFDNGSTCPGNNKYPADVSEIPDSFFRSFFTRGANISGRSKRHDKDITKLWKDLDGDKKYPLSDLIYHGIVNDLMQMKVS